MEAYVHQKTRTHTGKFKQIQTDTESHAHMQVGKPALAFLFGTPTLLFQPPVA